MMQYSTGEEINEELFKNYLQSLVGKVYKILPISETSKNTFPTYTLGLVKELKGFGVLVDFIQNDPSYMTMLSILTEISDNAECPAEELRRQVFSTISVCNKLIDRYAK